MSLCCSFWLLFSFTTFCISCSFGDSNNITKKDCVNDCKDASFIVSKVKDPCSDLVRFWHVVLTAILFRLIAYQLSRAFFSHTQFRLGKHENRCQFFNFLSVPLQCKIKTYDNLACQDIEPDFFSIVKPNIIDILAHLRLLDTYRQ